MTEENNPMNMGSFNYGNPVNEKLSHIIYDVLPFFEWGNTQKSEKQVNVLSDDPYPIEIKDGAMKRFEKYWELLYGKTAGDERKWKRSKVYNVYVMLLRSLTCPVKVRGNLR